MKLGTRKNFFVLYSLITIVLISCGDHNSPFVARVGGRRISLNDFETQFVKGKSTEQVKTATLEEKLKFLDKLIDNELKIIDAYQHNFDKDKKVDDLVSEREKRYIFQRLVEKEIIEKLIPESEVRDFYNKLAKRVKIRQILIKFDNKNEESKNRALIKAKSVIKRLKDGESFADIAEEISDDVNTAKKGGDKGYLSWGPNALNDPLYMAAFSMKTDEVSDVIETNKGFYIIKIVHIRKYKNPPYEQQKETIKQKIYSLRRAEIEKEYYQYLDKLRKKNKLKFYEKNLKVLVNGLQKSTLKEDKNIDLKNDTFIKKFDQNELTKIVASFKGNEIKIKDVVDILDKYPKHRLPAFKSILEIQNFINSRLVPEYLLTIEAKSKKIMDDSQFKNTLQSYKENVMINKIQTLQVQDKLNITDDELKKYYEENKKEFMHPTSREVQQIRVNEKELAENIVNRAKHGENFTRLYHLYDTEKKKDTINGDLGYITEGRAGIGRPAFKVKINEVTDPIKIGDSYLIIKVLSEKKPYPKTFEESKRLIEAKVKRIKMSEIENAWLKKLRSEVNLVVYENRLDKSLKDYVGDDKLMVE